MDAKRILESLDAIVTAAGPLLAAWGGDVGKVGQILTAANGIAQDLAEAVDAGRTLATTEDLMTLGELRARLAAENDRLTLIEKNR